MIELLETYSIKEILIFIVMIALAIKGLVSFFEWGVPRLRNVFLNEQQKEDKIHAIVCTQECHQKALEDIQKTIQRIDEQIALLIETDKHDIKSDITRQYHMFKELGYIDDYSLDCLEQRFKDYQRENGNSFVADLMYELRKLPKQSSIKIIKTAGE